MKERPSETQRRICYVFFLSLWATKSELRQRRSPTVKYWECDNVLPDEG
jgi:hypothetical protein